MSIDPVPPLSSDVVVVGGGPVGLTLALALAARGYSIALVDSRAIAGFNGVSDGRAYLTAAGCWRIFQSLGLGEALEAHSEPVLAIEAEGAGGSIGFGPEDADAGDALGYLIEGYLLEAELRKAVLANPRVVIHAPVQVTSIEVDGALARVSTDKGVVCGSLVVGCDGVRSIVRRAAGLRFEGRDYDAKAVSAILDLEGGHDGAARQVFLRTGPLAVLPLPNGRVNLVWSVPSKIADALVAMSDGDFLAELDKQSEGFVGSAKVVSAPRAFPLGLHVAEQFHAERIALAGDAAHQVHPLAGQGLNLGLKDVAALVDVIDEASRVGLDIGFESALAPYTRWRRADVTATAAAMDGFHSVFRGPKLVRGLAGALMQAAGGASAVREMFAREACGVTGELPSLMREVAGVDAAD